MVKFSKKYRNECKGWEYIEIESYVFSQRKELDQFCGNTATNHRSIEEKYSSKRRVPTSQFFYIFRNVIVTTHTIINIVCVISAAEDPQGKQALCPRVCLDISCVIINGMVVLVLMVQNIWYNQNDELLYNQDMIVMM